MYFLYTLLLRGGSCDVCVHMLMDTDHIESVFYKKKFAIHGHLTHLNKPPTKLGYINTTRVGRLVQHQNYPVGLSGHLSTC